MKGVLGVGAITATLGSEALKAEGRSTTPSFAFEELSSTPTDRAEVANGYNAEVLIRWGDPVLPGAPAFDPAAQTSERQRGQFGYNNDYLGYFPLPGAAEPGRHGLLCVNHEYTNEELMFPGLGVQDARARRLGREPFAAMTAELVAIEMAAHGGSVIEVRREGETWQVVANSRYARRITALTEMAITGPAAGHPRMRTKADPEGRKVLGMINNCAGGRHALGHLGHLRGEHQRLFLGRARRRPPGGPQLPAHGHSGRAFNWGDHHERFDINKEPNEANRFGWVVEIDPFDPASVPKKRTAIGRFKHEGAAGITAKNGHYVALFRRRPALRLCLQVRHRGPRLRRARAATWTCWSAARCMSPATTPTAPVEWLRLVHGEGPLTEANGFMSQADVVIEARRAADLLGATRMDRPEDVEANPATDKVYVMLTNNNQRTGEQVERRQSTLRQPLRPHHRDAAGGPRPHRDALHLGDPGALRRPFARNRRRDLQLGHHQGRLVRHARQLRHRRRGAPLGRDRRQHALQDRPQRRRLGDGDGRRGARHGQAVLQGAVRRRNVRPEFTPDGETFFVAIQHPGESDDENPNAPPATFENPSTRWPDFQPGMPPRPSIVAITRKGGGRIAV
ncbi:MAG: DUF839 domain-containing protein [Piscinibacter sp.]